MSISIEPPELIKKAKKLKKKRKYDVKLRKQVIKISKFIYISKELEKIRKKLFYKEFSSIFLHLINLYFSAYYKIENLRNYLVDNH